MCAKYRTLPIDGIFSPQIAFENLVSLEGHHIIQNCVALQWVKLDENKTAGDWCICTNRRRSCKKTIRLSNKIHEAIGQKRCLRRDISVYSDFSVD